MATDGKQSRKGTCYFSSGTEIHKSVFLPSTGSFALSHLFLSNLALYLPYLVLLSHSDVLSRAEQATDTTPVLRIRLLFVFCSRARGCVRVDDIDQEYSRYVLSLFRLFSFVDDLEFDRGVKSTEEASALKEGVG